MDPGPAEYSEREWQRITARLALYRDLHRAAKEYIKASTAADIAYNDSKFGEYDDWCEARRRYRKGILTALAALDAAGVTTEQENDHDRS